MAVRVTPLVVVVVALLALAPASARAADPAPATQPATRPAVPAVLFSTNFEGGSLAKVEVVDPDTFRCWVLGQHDARGHNRQTSWFYFRMDGVAGRRLTVTMTDLVGEYNDKPGAVPYGPDIVPVFSADGGRTWTHFAAEDAAWDDARKELTLKLAPSADTVYVAHIPPYVTADLDRLLADVRRSPHARVEAIGKTLGGRDLSMVTVTDVATPDAGKHAVWLQARQHAWEAGTSWAMDGALRWAVSDDPAAAELRKTTVFRFTPMVDLDGVAGGKVRFNGNGFDVNRHWPSVDLRDPEKLRLMPEIWYTKRAIVTRSPGEPPTALLVNLHNTETGEYLQTEADDDPTFERFRVLEDRLIKRGIYEPSRKVEKPKPKAIVKPPADTTTSLWATHQVPAALMELRVGTMKPLGRRRTVEDWTAFGRALIEEMARAR
ncbi:MAG TPA: M14-type cytosolic carboxypeptidase [Humisphaera sp.]